MKFTSFLALILGLSICSFANAQSVKLELVKPQVEKPNQEEETQGPEIDYLDEEDFEGEPILEENQMETEYAPQPQQGSTEEEFEHALFLLNNEDAPLLPYGEGSQTIVEELAKELNGRVRSVANQTASNRDEIKELKTGFSDLKDRVDGSLGEMAEFKAKVDRTARKAVKESYLALLEEKGLKESQNKSTEKTQVAQKKTPPKSKASVTYERFENGVVNYRPLPESGSFKACEVCGSTGACIRDKHGYGAPVSNVVTLPQRIQVNPINPAYSNPAPVRATPQVLHTTRPAIQLRQQFVPHQRFVVPQQRSYVVPPSPVFSGSATKI